MLKLIICATGQNISATIGDTKVTDSDGNEYLKTEVMLPYQRIDLKETRHLYRVGVRVAGVEGQIDVEATNRDQAARISERQGYEVCDVNMIG